MGRRDSSEKTDAFPDSLFCPNCIGGFPERAAKTTETPLFRRRPEKPLSGLEQNRTGSLGGENLPPWRLFSGDAPCALR